MLKLLLLLATVTIARADVPTPYDFGCSPYAADNLACFDTMLTTLAGQNKFEVKIPPGNWKLSGQLKINYPFSMCGVNKSKSALVPTHTATAVLVTGNNGTGGKLCNLGIARNHAGLGNGGLHLWAQTNGSSPDFFEVIDVVITGFNQSVMNYGLIVDGSARTGGKLGIRNVKVRGLDIFNTNWAAVSVRQGRAIHFSQTNCFQGDGTTNRVEVFGPSVDNPSDTVIFTDVNCGPIVVGPHAINVRIPYWL